MLGASPKQSYGKKKESKKDGWERSSHFQKPKSAYLDIETLEA
jgi:hypothetical protein